MAWEVLISRKTAKAAGTLPKAVRASLSVLLKEIELSGPIRGNWPNYGKLGKGRHHCHLKKGAPTYVAVWEEKTGRVKLVEVIYVGTHEKAPY
jgi:mRNA-degrading endonuclease RelE of RelBE toxin-antitoxin system